MNRAPEMSASRHAGAREIRLSGLPGEFEDLKKLPRSLILHIKASGDVRDAVLQTSICLDNIVLPTLVDAINRRGIWIKTEDAVPDDGREVLTFVLLAGWASDTVCLNNYVDGEWRFMPRNGDCVVQWTEVPHADGTVPEGGTCVPGRQWAIYKRKGPGNMDLIDMLVFDAGWTSLQVKTRLEERHWDLAGCALRGEGLVSCPTCAINNQDPDGECSQCGTELSF